MRAKFLLKPVSRDARRSRRPERTKKPFATCIGSKCGLQCDEGKLKHAFYQEPFHSALKSTPRMARPRPSVYDISSEHLFLVCSSSNIHTIYPALQRWHSSKTRPPQEKAWRTFFCRPHPDVSLGPGHSLLPSAGGLSPILSSLQSATQLPLASKKFQGGYLGQCLV